MNVSVVVPAYNEEESIGDCLEALGDQDYQGEMETIVIDDGSSDRTAEIAEGFDGVRVIRQEQAGPAAARNRGVEEAAGDYILFTDADCVPGERWVSEMAESLEEAEAVQGSYRSRQGGLVPGFAQLEIENRHRRLGERAGSIATGCSAVRADVFRELGGFDTRESGVFGEDTDLSYRLLEKGYTIAFNPDAFVYHRHPESLLEYLRQKFGRGVMTGAFLLKRHGKRLAEDPYKGHGLALELGILGLFLLSVAAVTAGYLPGWTPAAVLGLWWITTLPFTFHLLKNSLSVGLLSPFLIFFRDLSLLSGLAAGLAGFR